MSEGLSSHPEQAPADPKETAARYSYLLRETRDLAKRELTIYDAVAFLQGHYREAIKQRMTGDWSGHELSQADLKLKEQWKRDNQEQIAEWTSFVEFCGRLRAGQQGLDSPETIVWLTHRLDAIALTKI